MEKLIQFPRTAPVREPPKRLLAPSSEVKSVPVVNFPLSLFWGPTGDRMDREGGDKVHQGPTAYAIAALAYICMSFRATKLIEAPLWIREEKDGAETWLEGDHELADLLEQPNVDMEMADLLEMTSLFLDSTGKVIWLKAKDNRNVTRALYPFAGDEFSVESDSKRLYANFRIQTARGPRDFAPEDVIYFRNVDPRGHLDGMAPLEAALSLLNIGDHLKRSVRALLKNMIRPGTVLSVEGRVDADDRKQLEADLKVMFGGVDNTGKGMIVDRGGKVERLTTALNDLSFGPIQDDIEATVCAIFRTHPALLGLNVAMKNSSGLSDSIKPAQTLFYDLFALPTWGRIERTITRQLLREVDENPLRFIRFDTENVRALKVDISARVTEAAAAVNFWTKNEQRAHTLKGPLKLPDGTDDPRGETIGTPLAANPFAGLFGQNGETPPKARIIPETRQLKSGTKGTRLELWQKFDSKARSQEADYELAARHQFEEESEDIRRILTTDAPAKASKENGSLLAPTLASEIRRIRESKDAYDRFIDAALKLIAENYKPGGKYHAGWLERYRALISRTFNIAGSALGAQFGFDFDLENPRVQTAIDQRANLLAGEVSATTFQQLKDVISEGRSAGAGIPEIADNVNSAVFGDMADARSVVIARTETVGAMNRGEQMAAVLSGVIQSKEWLTQGDDRVRDSHVALDGIRIGLDARYPNGLRYPHDPEGPPEEVIQCRCGQLFSDEPPTKAKEPEVPKTKKKEITFHNDGNGIVTGATILEQVLENALHD